VPFAGCVFHQKHFAGTNDTFLAIIAPTNGVLSVVSDGQKADLEWPYAPEYRLESSTNGGINWTVVRAKPLLTNGWNMLTIDPASLSDLFRLSK